MLEWIALGIAAVIGTTVVVKKLIKKDGTDVGTVDREMAKNYYFEVWSSKNGPRFRLKKVEDEDILLHGEAYSSFAALNDTLSLLAKATGIEVRGEINDIDSTVDEELGSSYYFEVWASKNGPRFRLKHTNGEIVLHGEAYSSLEALNEKLTPLVEATGIEARYTLDVPADDNADEIADAEIVEE